MKSLFKRHRVRAGFYHIVGALYAYLALITLLSVGGDVYFWCGFLLFALDYLAEMYDPHPDNPGPWFKAHFHRMLKDDDDEEEE